MKQIFLSLLTLVYLSSSGRQVESFFYREQELSLSPAGGSILSGTLTIPNSKDSNSLVAIIVGGSGPTDRDGNQYGAMYPNTYKFLAHDLAQRGITAFRYDKRGVGASASAGVNESKLTFDSYIQDLSEWISYLRMHRKFKNIVLVGHSEGALVSFVAGKRANANAYISLAAPGSPIDSILAAQIKERMPALVGKATPILDKLRNKETVDSIPKELAVLFRPGVQPFLISMMAYDPCREIADIKAPILIIQGDNDLQIKQLEAAKLTKAKPDATFVTIPGMNHVLKISDKDLGKNFQLYNSVSTPISARVSQNIEDFLRKNYFVK
ncbi:alpha/beta fold hydrolase [uncultured Chitinophaga sp.]|jgi:Lysophospholipase|uniref:alpha/beta hydrolase n=1 Tax=uncultured Chitinophaga sp. TaxID=339340 RepID=UPI00262D0EE7|nr:alpha/beta fold hydrolase [uncultured Chitinophaga sp.]